MNNSPFNRLNHLSENQKTVEQKEIEPVEECMMRLANLAAIQEASTQVVTKNYSDSYLYHKGAYEKNIMQFLLEAEEVNKNDPSFKEIINMVKMQPFTYLSNVLRSDRVVLLTKLPKSMPRSFKVFCAKDVRKGTGNLKVYIDVTGVINPNGTVYSLSSGKLNELVCYLTSAMIYTIYYLDPIRFVNNTKLTEYGASCFSLLFTHVIDYLRVGGVSRVREKTIYLSVLYYHICILNGRMSDSVRNRAIKLSGLTSKETSVIDYQLNEHSFDNINTFIETITNILVINNGMKLDNFVEKWIFLYKTGTQFALELFPAFATMMTNAFHGAYINNQKTIEKVTNNGKDMVAFSRTILQIGSEML